MDLVHIFSNILFPNQILAVVYSSMEWSARGTFIYINIHMFNNGIVTGWKMHISHDDYYFIGDHLVAGAVLLFCGVTSHHTILNSSIFFFSINIFLFYLLSSYMAILPKPKRRHVCLERNFHSEYSAYIQSG